MSIAMPADVRPSSASHGPPFPRMAPGSPPPPGAEPPFGDPAGGEWAPTEITANGRLRRTGLDEQDRMLGVGLHLWWLALLLPTGPLAVALPIGLWLWKRQRSDWLDDNGREVINFGLSQLILSVGLGLTVVGLVLLPVLWVVAFVNIVRGAIAAGRGEYFRYPMTFRML